MTHLTILRGYPGSGKTTWAKKLVKDGYIRVNRDDLRASLYADEGVLSQDKEANISRIQKDIAKNAISNGISVVCDDTNLRLKYAKDWADLAYSCGAEFEVIDVNTNVNECIRRNEDRKASGGRYVPVEVIRGMANKFPYPWPEVTRRIDSAVFEKAPDFDSSLDEIVLCDIDGTVARMINRGPYDFHRVTEDEPIQDIIDLINLLYNEYEIIFFSGRDDSCEEDTYNWLWDALNGMDLKIYMRKTGDKRPDDKVKYEMYNQHIRGKYNVKFVVDDRLRVARMWHKLGLTLLKVGDPDSNF